MWTIKNYAEYNTALGAVDDAFSTWKAADITSHGVGYQEHADIVARFQTMHDDMAIGAAIPG